MNVLPAAGEIFKWGAGRKAQRLSGDFEDQMISESVKLSLVAARFHQNRLEVCCTPALAKRSAPLGSAFRLEMSRWRERFTEVKDKSAAKEKRNDMQLAMRSAALIHGR